MKRSLTLVALFVPLICAASLPVWIEPNRGQFEPGVDFTARSGSWQAGLRGGAVVLTSGDGERIAMLFDGSRSLRAAEPEGARLPGVSSYFRGNDSSKWITGVPHYSRIRYRDVYPGIDLIYYGSADGKLEYDFELAPTADAGKIRMRFDGAARVEQTSTGDLKIMTASGRHIVQRAPRVFEERHGVRREVTSHYRLDGALSVRFEIAKRAWSDAKLIVDPVLEYATFAGGAAFDSARALACDNNGNCFMAGEGRSRNGLVGPMQSSGNGGQEVVVVKINHQTNTLGYYAVIGGDMDDVANAIVLDSSGAVYIAGTTKSLNFPTRNAAQPNPGGAFLSDAFVAKLAPDGGTLQYSTYVGGSGAEEGRGLAVDKTGAAYLVGSTGSRDSFPLTPGVFQNNFRGALLVQSATGFITKLNPTGSRWSYSTLFGGSRQDEVRSVAVDDAGQVVIIGSTTSLDFPLANAWQSRLASSLSGFVARFNADGSKLLFSTYFGGPSVNSLFGGVGISMDAVLLEASGNIVIGGSTSSGGFPVADASQAVYGGGRSDGFVASMTGSGSELSWFKYLGGSDADGVLAMAQHRDGTITCVGYTASPNFPLRFSAQQPGGKIDAFVTRFTASSGALQSSSLLGGAEEDRALAVSVDATDAVLVAGWTASRDFPFPRQGGGVQPVFGGGAGDMFLARLVPDSPGLTFVIPPLLTSTSVLSFSTTVGSLRPPAPVAIQVVSGSLQPVGFTVEWSVNGLGNWLSAGPPRAETPATIHIFANPSGLVPGTYVGVVRLVPLTGGVPALINVTAQVLNPPAEILSLSPSWVEAGSSDFEVTLRGKGFAQGASVRMVAEDASGTTILSAVSTSLNSLTFVVPRSLVFRDSSFEIRAANPEAELSNPVSLLVGGRTARVLARAVISAATGVAGPIAPGQMVLITGQGMGPAEFVRPEVNNSVLGNRAGGVRVLFDGVPAPMQFASDRQICVMAPYAIAASTTVEMTVEYNGERSSPMVLQVTATQPGILMPDSYVYGYGSIVNETGVENTASVPAKRNAIVSFAISGAGVLASGADGRLGLGATPAAPIAPISVTVDGRDAELVVVSESPGQASGLVLVRVRVPQTARSGDVALAVKSGDAVSPSVRMFVE